MKQIVRVTRTWDVEVEAEYGDTPETLVEKVAVSKLGAPNGEDRVLLPGESPYPRYAQLVCPDCEPGDVCAFHAKNPRSIKEQ